MRTLKIFLALSAVCLLLFVLGTDAQVKPLNLIVIIDTSNRVSPQLYPKQRQRDISILKEVVDEFEVLAKVYLSRRRPYPHRLTFVVPQQQNVEPMPRDLVKRLKIPNPRSRPNYPDFIRQKKALVAAIDELYDLAENQYTGSDIWDWFKYRAERYFSEEHDNRIICLSDGYLNFDEDIEKTRLPRTYMCIPELRDADNYKQRIREDKGLLPIGKDFSRFDVKFYMLEIRPRHPNDYEILKCYWQTWFNAMGIETTDFIRQDDPYNLKSMLIRRRSR